MRKRHSSRTLRPEQGLATGSNMEDAVGSSGMDISRYDVKVAQDIKVMEHRRSEHQSPGNKTGEHSADDKESSRTLNDGGESRKVFLQLSVGPSAVAGGRSIEVEGDVEEKEEESGFQTVRSSMSEEAKPAGKKKADPPEVVAATKSSDSGDAASRHSGRSARTTMALSQLIQASVEASHAGSFDNEEKESEKVPGIEKGAEGSLRLPKPLSTAGGAEEGTTSVRGDDGNESDGLAARYRTSAGDKKAKKSSLPEHRGGGLRKRDSSPDRSVLSVASIASGSVSFRSIQYDDEPRSKSMDNDMKRSDDFSASNVSRITWGSTAGDTENSMPEDMLPAMPPSSRDNEEEGMKDEGGTLLEKPHLLPRSKSEESGTINTGLASSAISNNMNPAGGASITSCPSSQPRAPAVMLSRSNISSYFARESSRKSKIDKIHELKSKNSELKTGVATLKAQLRMKENRLRDIVSSSSLQVNSLETQLRDASVSAESLKKQEKEEDDNRIGTVKALSETASKLNEKLRKKTRQCLAAEANLGKLRAQIENMEIEKKELDERVLSLTAEKAATTTEIECLQVELTGQLDRVEQLEFERDRNADRAMEIEGQLTVELERIETLQAENEEKDKQIDQREEELLAKSDEADVIRNHLDVKLKRVAELEVELQVLNDKLDRTEVEHSREMEEMKRKHEEAIEQLRVHEAEVMADAAEQNKRGGGRRLSRLLHGSKSKSSLKQQTGGSSRSVGTAEFHPSPSTQNHDSIAIQQLHRTIETNESVISKLRSDIVHINTRYKEDKYRSKTEIAKLTQENEAYALKVEVLEKEFQRFNMDNLSVATDIKGSKSTAHSGMVSSTVANASTSSPADVAAGEGAMVVTRAEIGCADSKEDGNSITVANKTQPMSSEYERFLFLESRIKSLEHEKQLYKSTIDNLNSDMVRLQRFSLDVNITGKKPAEELTAENEVKNAKDVAVEKEYVDANDASGGSIPSGSQATASSKLKNKEAEISRLQRAGNVQRQTVASLKAEIMNLRIALKAQAYQNEREIAALKEDNDANAMKAEVLEREFYGCANGSGQEQKERNEKGPQQSDAAQSLSSIVQLDANLVQDLRDQLSKSEDMVHELNSHILRQRAASQTIEGDLRRELRLLTKEKDMLVERTTGYKSISVDASPPDDDDDLFLSEDLMGSYTFNGEGGVAKLKHSASQSSGPPSLNEHFAREAEGPAVLVQEGPCSARSQSLATVEEEA